MGRLILHVSLLPSRTELPMLSRLTAALQAIILAVLAYAAFSLADAFAKQLAHVYGAPLCVTLGGAIALIVQFIWIMLQRGWRGFKTKQIKLHLIRGVSIAIIANLVVRTLQLLPLPDFYGIVFLTPFIVVMLSAVILKEQLKPYRLAVVVLAFCGVLVIAGPQFQALSTGVLMTAVIVFISSLNVFVMRRMGQHEYLPLYGFFPFLFISLSGIPQIFPNLDMLTKLTLQDSLSFLLYGFTLIVGHTAIPLAFSRTPEMSLIAPMHYTQMLWGILYGILLFHQPPTPTTLLGGSIIIGSGLYMIWRERHHVRHPKKQS